MKRLLGMLLALTALSLTAPTGADDTLDEVRQAAQRGDAAVETVYLQTQQDKKQQAKMDPADRAAGYLQQMQKQLKDPWISKWRYE